MKLVVVLERSEEGGFSVLVLTHPGCISEGETREEAIKNIREAIKLYLEPVDDDNNRRKHTSNEILMHTKSMAWTHGHFLNFANLSFEPLTAVSSEYSLFPYSVGKAIVGNFLCNGSILYHVELV